MAPGAGEGAGGVQRTRRGARAHRCSAPTWKRQRGPVLRKPVFLASSLSAQAVGWGGPDRTPDVPVCASPTTGRNCLRSASDASPSCHVFNSLHPSFFLF